LSAAGFMGVLAWQRSKRSDVAVRTLAFASASLIALDFVAFVQYNVHFFQAQGRYFLPALLPLTMGLVFGIERLLPVKYRGYVAPVLLGFLLLINFAALGIIKVYFQSAAAAV